MMEIITEAFTTLRSAGCVSSQRHFSNEWLGRRSSYMSSMASRAATRTPSLGVLLYLYGRVRNYIEDAEIQQPTIRQSLEQLADRVWAAVMDRVKRRPA